MQSEAGAPMDIKRQRDRYLAFSFACSDLLIEVEANGQVSFALGAASELGKNDSTELVGARFFDLFEPADAPMLEHMHNSVAPGRRRGPVCVTPRGQSTKVSVNACMMPDDLETRFIAITAPSATSLIAADADRDEDTGLLNPEDFEKVASDMLADLHGARRDAQMTLFTLYKQNELVERLGQQERQKLLGKIGGTLRAVSVGDSAARIDADKYTVLHDASVNPAEIENEIVEASKDADPENEGVTVSRQTIHIDPDVTPRDATRALIYTVNTFAAARDDDVSSDVQSLDQVIETLLEETNLRIARFRQSIAEARVGFVAQPIVDLASGATNHYEMLVRFEPGESPFEMVSFAEKTGIVADLDLASADAAIRFLTRDAAADFCGLAINISGLSITTPAVVDTLLDRLKTAEFPSQKLTFEITESAEIENLPAADAAIQALRARGHQVCLDDFGAGAASFPYLRALTIDGVKIDGAYVREALKSARDALLLRAMARLCEDLNVYTIAEMVETDEHHQHVSEIGVDMGQGWFFGRPVPLSSLTRRQAA